MDLPSLVVSLSFHGEPREGERRKKKKRKKKKKALAFHRYRLYKVSFCLFCTSVDIQ